MVAVIGNGTKHAFSNAGGGRLFPDAACMCFILLPEHLYHNAAVTSAKEETSYGDKGLSRREVPSNERNWARSSAALRTLSFPMASWQAATISLSSLKRFSKEPP